MYTDHFFTGNTCAEYLFRNSINLTGTVMNNLHWLTGRKLKSEERNLQRCEWDEIVQEDDKIGLSYGMTAN